MGVRIITDSTCDINKIEEQLMGINVVPLKVLFGDKEYREGIDITMETFYKKLIETDKLPTTSQPAPDDFIKYYNEAKEAGDSIIVILIASKFSGTVQSATIAKDIVDYDDIHIIDSTTTITGLRILVEEATKLRDQNVEAKEIVDKLNGLKDRIVLLAMVDTLEYLHKGGRLSKSSAILGTLLKFKPILQVKDGVIGVLGKERGVNKGIAKVLELMDEVGEIDYDYPVYFGYTAEDDKGIMLKEKASEKYGLTNTNLYPVGCVVGTHAGPGASVVAYIKK